MNHDPQVDPGHGRSVVERRTHFAMKKVGGKMLLTPALQTRICNLLSQGSAIKSACCAASRPHSSAVIARSASRFKRPKAS